MSTAFAKIDDGFAELLGRAQQAIADGWQAEPLPDYRWKLSDFTDSAALMAEVNRVSTCLNELPYRQICEAIKAGVFTTNDDLQSLATCVDSALLGIKMGPIGEGEEGHIKRVQGYQSIWYAAQERIRSQS